jgi:hypothetical protein
VINYINFSLLGDIIILTNGLCFTLYIFLLRSIRFVVYIDENEQIRGCLVIYVDGKYNSSSVCECFGGRRRGGGGLESSNLNPHLYWIIFFKKKKKI